MKKRVFQKGAEKGSGSSDSIRCGRVCSAGYHNSGKGKDSGRSD